MIKYHPKSNEKYMPFLHCISSFEGNSCKTLQIQPPQIFYFWLFLLRVVFTSADIIFQNFIELHWIFSENLCQHEFSIFNKLTHHPKRPHPVNGRNLLSVTTFFLLMLSYYLPTTSFKISAAVSEHQSRISQVNCECLILNLHNK